MQNAEPPLRSAKNFLLLTFGVMFLAAIFTFGESIGYGFSILDDRFLVLGNLYIRGPTFTNIAFAFTHFDPELYIPLTFLSYQITYLFSGLNAAGYHFGNILLHAGNATLVTVVAMQISGKRWLALIAGLIFCLHPLNSEAVVWVAGRKDILSTLFALLTVALYIRYRTTGEKFAYLLTVLTLLLGLLSKASVMTIPVVLLLIDIGIEQRKISRSMLMEKLPHIGLAAIFGTVAWLAKSRVVHASSVWETFLMAGKSMVFYLQKLFVPTGLTPLYPWNGPIELSDPNFGIPLILLVFMFIVGALLTRKERSIPTAILILFVTLSPTFFNFNKGDSVFFAVDRYAYMPGIAMILLVCIAADSLIGRLTQPSLRRNIRFAAMAIPIMLAVFALRQTQTWATDITMLQRAAELYPASAPARVSLAAAYRETGDERNEEKTLVEGLTFVDHVALHTSLGSVYARQGKFEEAKREYQKGLALDATNPEPLFFLGSLLEEEGKPDEALSVYKQAIALDDSYTAAYNNAGAILRERKDVKAAEEMFRSAVWWNPSFWEGEYNLFDVLASSGRAEEGLAHLEKAYALAPDEPEIAISLTYQYHAQGKGDEAQTIINEALVRDPENRAMQRMRDFISTPR